MNDKGRTSLYALHTLDDSETLARLSSGIQRLSYPTNSIPSDLSTIIERFPTALIPTIG